MVISKPVPFIKAIKVGGVVAPGLSKLGQKVPKYQRLTQIQDNYWDNGGTDLIGFFSDIERSPPPIN